MNVDKIHKYRWIALLLSSMTCFCLFSSVVCADVGPKPSVTIQVKNAPSSDYYIALISNQSHYLNREYKPNDQLSDRENEIIAFLYSYDVDGYTLYPGPGESRKYYSKSNENERYYFGYMLPSSFKLLLITYEGDVQVSNEISKKFLNAYCEYDWSTNTLEESIFEMTVVAQFFGKTFLCVLATLVIEGIVLALFGLFSKDNLVYFVRINLITQLLLMIFNMSVYLIDDVNYYYLFLCMEILITVIEAVYYRKRLKNKVNQTASQPKNIVYAIVANLSSVGVGFVFLISYYLG